MGLSLAVLGFYLITIWYKNSVESSLESISHHVERRYFSYVEDGVAPEKLKALY